MSFWDNNKDSFKAAGLATARGIGRGTKAVSKAGYNTYKSHEAKRKGLPPPDQGNSSSSAPPPPVDYQYKPPDKETLALLPKPVKRNVGAYEPPKPGEKSKYPTVSAQSQQNTMTQGQPQYYPQNQGYQQQQDQGFQQQGYQTQPQVSQQPQYQQPQYQQPQYQQPQYQQPQYQQPQQQQQFQQPSPQPSQQQYQQPHQPLYQQTPQDQSQYQQQTQPPAYVQAPGTAPAAAPAPISSQAPAYTATGAPPVAQRNAPPPPPRSDSSSIPPSGPQREAVSPDHSTGSSKQSMFRPDVDLSQFAPPPIHKDRGSTEPSPAPKHASLTGLSIPSKESVAPSNPPVTQLPGIRQHQSTAPDPTKFAPPPPIRRGGQPPAPTAPTNAADAPTSGTMPVLPANQNSPAIPPARGPPPALPLRNSDLTAASKPAKVPPPKPATKPSFSSHPSSTSTSTVLPPSLPDREPRTNSPPPPYKVTENEAESNEPARAAQNFSDSSSTGPNFAAEIARLRSTVSTLSTEDETTVLKKVPPPKPAKPSKPAKPAKLVNTLSVASPAVAAKPKIAAKPEITPKPEVAAKSEISAMADELKSTMPKPQVAKKPEVAAKPSADAAAGIKTAPPPLPRRESHPGNQTNVVPPRKLPPVTPVVQPKPQVTPQPSPKPTPSEQQAAPPPPKRNYERKPAPLPPQASAASAMGEALPSPHQNGPPNLDLEMGSGWFMVTDGPIEFPRALSGLNYTTSYMYSTRGGPGGMKKTSTRELTVRLKDLARVKYKFKWENDDVQSATVEIAEFMPSPITHRVPLNAELVAYSQQYGEHVAAWALHHEGQRVDRGECWDLAKFALEKGCGKHAFISTYTHHGFPILEVHGSPNGATVVRPQADEIRRGDILQFTTAKFENKATGSWLTAGDPDHTSVVIDKVGAKVMVLEQNVGGVKIVKRGEYEIGNITQGSVVGYRPMPASWIE